MVSRLKKIARNIGYEVSVRRTDKVKYLSCVDEYFRRLHDKYRETTIVSVEGLHQTYNAVRYISENNIPGSIVECGVFKGGCMAMMAEASTKFSKVPRDFYLFESFAGMTEPGPEDFRPKDPTTRDHVLDTFKRQQRDDHNEWVYSPLSEVKATLGRTAIPEDRFACVVGPVEDTLPYDGIGEIALLRLDTNWYSSTRHELQHLYDLVVEDGVIIVDDYKNWAGSRRAVEEFLEERKLSPLRFFTHGRLAFIKTRSLRNRRVG